MKRQDPPFAPDLDALLEQGKIISAVPDVVRARSLARARAALATAAVAPPEPVPATRGHGLRLALAASVALAVGAAGAVAALRLRASDSRVPAPPSSPRAVPPVRTSTADLPAALPAVDPQRSSGARPHPPSRSATAQASYAAELHLLQRAQVAYVGRDFSGTLVLVAEHVRRFPNGRLTEEREALRVRSLARSGRTDEARRAAATFANRFPRSVLLPRLLETSAARE